MLGSRHDWIKLMNARTIIVHSDRGIFLGTYAGYIIFSKQDTLESTKAYGFETEERARSYVESYLPTLKDDVVFVSVGCSNSSVYVDVVDIIKAGYWQYAEEMFANLPVLNHTIH